MLDRNAGDLITPSATVNVVPHLDPEARVIVETPNGPAVQTNEGPRRFAKIGKHDRTSHLQQLECEMVRTETRHRWWWNFFCGREATRATE